MYNVRDCVTLSTERIDFEAIRDPIRRTDVPEGGAALSLTSVSEQCKIEEILLQILADILLLVAAVLTDDVWQKVVFSLHLKFNSFKVEWFIFVIVCLERVAWGAHKTLHFTSVCKKLYIIFNDFTKITIKFNRFASIIHLENCAYYAGFLFTIYVCNYYTYR